MTQSELMDQIYAENKERVAAAFVAKAREGKTVVSAYELADIIGVPAEQLKNAIWEGTCHFGWGHRGEHAKSKQTAFYIDTTWACLYGPGVTNPVLVKEIS